MDYIVHVIPLEQIVTHDGLAVGRNAYRLASRVVDPDAVVVLEPGLHGRIGAVFIDDGQFARADPGRAEEGDSVLGGAVAAAAALVIQLGYLPGGHVIYDGGGNRERRLHDLLRIIEHRGGDVASVGGDHGLGSVVAHQPVVLDNQGAFPVVHDIALLVPVAAQLVGPVGPDAGAVRRHGLDHESGIGFLTRIGRFGTGQEFDLSVFPAYRFVVAAGSDIAAAKGSVWRDGGDGAAAVPLSVELLPFAVAELGRHFVTRPDGDAVIRNIEDVDLVGHALLALDRVVNGFPGFDVVNDGVAFERSGGPFAVVGYVVEGGSVLRNDFDVPVAFAVEALGDRQGCRQLIGFHRNGG